MTRIRKRDMGQWIVIDPPGCDPRARAIVRKLCRKNALPDLRDRLTRAEIGEEAAHIQALLALVCPQIDAGGHQQTSHKQLNQAAEFLTACLQFLQRFSPLLGSADTTENTKPLPTGDLNP